MSNLICIFVHDWWETATVFVNRYGVAVKIKQKQCRRCNKVHQ